MLHPSHAPRLRRPRRRELCPLGVPRSRSLLLLVLLSRPWRRGSRRALRGIRPSGAVRLYADRAFLIPASRRPRSLASAALAERAETLAGIRRVLGSKPGLRFCRFGRGFAVISGYFWLFLAISGLGASPGGPGSKLIILRATGESQESALLHLLQCTVLVQSY